MAQQTRRTALTASLMTGAESAQQQQQQESKTEMVSTLPAAGGDGGDGGGGSGGGEGARRHRAPPPQPGQCAPVPAPPVVPAPVPPALGTAALSSLSAVTLPSLAAGGKTSVTPRASATVARRESGRPASAGDEEGRQRHDSDTLSPSPSSRTMSPSPPSGGKGRKGHVRSVSSDTTSTPRSVAAFSADTMSSGRLSGSGGSGRGADGMAIYVGSHSEIGGRDYQEDRVVVVPDFNALIPPDILATDRKAMRTGMPQPRSFFACFDGHGGSQCSDFLANVLHHELGKHRMICTNPTAALELVWRKVETMFYEYLVGLKEEKEREQQGYHDQRMARIRKEQDDEEQKATKANEAKNSNNVDNRHSAHSPQPGGEIDPNAPSVGSSPPTPSKRRSAQTRKTQTAVGAAQAGQVFIPLAMDGSTAVVGLIVGSRLYVANCGDSDAMLLDNALEGLTVTDRHNTTNAREIERVQKHGSDVRAQHVVEPLPFPCCCSSHTVIAGKPRIYPGGLLLTRSFGDFHAKLVSLGGKPGSVIPYFERVRTFELRDSDTGAVRYKYLLLASDGFWDTLDEDGIGLILDVATTRAASTVAKVAKQHAREQDQQGEQEQQQRQRELQPKHRQESSSSTDRLRQQRSASSASAAGSLNLESPHRPPPPAPAPPNPDLYHRPSFTFEGGDGGTVTSPSAQEQLLAEGAASTPRGAASSPTVQELERDRGRKSSSSKGRKTSKLSELEAGHRSSVVWETLRKMRNLSIGGEVEERAAQKNQIGPRSRQQLRQTASVDSPVSPQAGGAVRRKSFEPITDFQESRRQFGDNAVIVGERCNGVDYNSYTRFHKPDNRFDRFEESQVLVESSARFSRQALSNRAVQTTPDLRDSADSSSPTVRGAGARGSVAVGGAAGATPGVAAGAGGSERMSGGGRSSDNSRGSHSQQLLSGSSRASGAATSHTAGQLQERPSDSWDEAPPGGPTLISATLNVTARELVERSVHSSYWTRNGWSADNSSVVLVRFGLE